MVPYFDPVPIEVAPGFRLTRGFNLANVFGLTKGKAIGMSTLVVLSPLVPLCLSRFRTVRRLITSAIPSPLEW
ncbi:MAG: hypothetical protein WA439_08505 [Pseudolabrys sp.]